MSTVSVLIEVISISKFLSRLLIIYIKYKRKKRAMAKKAAAKGKKKEEEREITPSEDALKLEADLVVICNKLKTFFPSLIAHIGDEEMEEEQLKDDVEFLSESYKNVIKVAQKQLQYLSL